MARHFDNWLAGYMDYAVDGFCPDSFHYWTGVSTLAGALERKVWIPWSDEWHIYPNMYIFLVSTPGVGKSSAMRKGTDELLRTFEDVRILPSQITEARLIELMAGARKTFSYGGNERVHSSAFFFASEASNSLKAIYGDLKACFTDWYDCGRIWDKGTQKDGETKIYNVCFNMLAGCTFDYLGKLIPEEEIMGGFASRLLYVVQEGRVERTPMWGASAKVNQELKGKLLEDLTHIHNLTGKFKASQEVQERYVVWAKENEARLSNMISEKFQAFLARKHVNIMKLAMIQSVAEGNSLVLELKHWEAAETLVNDLEKHLPRLISISSAGGKDNHSAIIAIMAEYAKKRGEAGMDPGEIRRHLFMAGIDGDRTEKTIGHMQKNGLMKIELYRGKPAYFLTDDAHVHLQGEPIPQENLQDM